MSQRIDVFLIAFDGDFAFIGQLMNIFGGDLGFRGFHASFEIFGEFS